MVDLGPECYETDVRYQLRSRANARYQITYHSHRLQCQVYSPKSLNFGRMTSLCSDVSPS